MQDDHQTLIAKLMQVESTNDIYKDVTYEELKLAGDLYIYLEMCPDVVKDAMMRLELEQMMSSGTKPSIMHRYLCHFSYSRTSNPGNFNHIFQQSLYKHI